MDAAQETFLACDDLGVSIVSTCWGIYKTKPERVLIDIFKISGASHFNEIEKKSYFFFFVFANIKMKIKILFTEDRIIFWDGVVLYFECVYVLHVSIYVCVCLCLCVLVDICRQCGESL